MGLAKLRNIYYWYYSISNTALILFIGPPEDFHYTNQGGCFQVTDGNDQSDFSTTREALQLLGFHDNQQLHLFRVLAAILHLGNTEIGSSVELEGEGCYIDPGDCSLENAATLLGVDPTQLHKWLCNRRIATAREVYTKPLTPSQVKLEMELVAS